MIATKSPPTAYPPSDHSPILLGTLAGSRDLGSVWGLSWGGIVPTTCDGLVRHPEGDGELEDEARMQVLHLQRALRLGVHESMLAQ